MDWCLNYSPAGMDWGIICRGGAAGVFVFGGGQARGGKPHPAELQVQPGGWNLKKHHSNNEIQQGDASIRYNPLSFGNDSAFKVLIHTG
jgi:hypothetical protein